jgi:hypothetical protein
MQRINQYWFYQLGMVIHPLADLKGGMPLQTVIIDIYYARDWLEYLLSDRFIPLVISKPAGRRLLSALDAVIQPPQPEPGVGIVVGDRDVAPPGEEGEAAEPVLTFQQAYAITSALQVFETVLSAELQALASYFVSKKGIYETSDLIENADNALPDTIRATLTDEAKHDICQAGRCLAFDLPTAAGFHVLRAAESVIRQYYGLVVGALPKAKARNWGAYIKVLGEHGGDARILAALGQIKDLQRNPIMHPEVTLDMEDALTLFNMTQGVIVAMVKDMEKRRAATAGRAAAAPPVAPAGIP